MKPKSATSTQKRKQQDKYSTILFRTTLTKLLITAVITIRILWFRQCLIDLRQVHDEEVKAEMNKDPVQGLGFRVQDSGFRPMQGSGVTRGSMW